MPTEYLPTVITYVAIKYAGRFLLETCFLRIKKKKVDAFLKIELSYVTPHNSYDNLCTKI